MVWIIGIILGVLLSFKIPNAPFLGVVIMGVIIVWFSVFIGKLFGLGKNE
ncbi:hypothetical protein [Paraglaciecola sp. MB-3u-78]|jgi:hypothetical protein|nr:hypothetical protein [Paraglaciecola sp. MB-3u-78]